MGKKFKTSAALSLILRKKKKKKLRNFKSNLKVKKTFYFFTFKIFYKDLIFK